MPVIPIPPPADPTAPKEPHEMTCAEFRQQSNGNPFFGRESIPGESVLDLQKVRNEHRMLIMAAIAAGKTVPDAIMSEHYLLATRESARPVRPARSLAPAHRSSTMQIETRLKCIGDLILALSEHDPAGRFEFLVDGVRYLIPSTAMLVATDSPGEPTRLQITLLKERRKSRQ